MKFLYFLKRPKEFLVCLISRKFFFFIPDQLFLKLKFRLMMNYKLELNNVQTYNEKLQWLKLNDQNPIYTSLVDKYSVREFVKRKIGEEYLIPLLGVYERFDDIDFSKLPNEFVIKCTHDSGGVVICKNKDEFDFKKSRYIIEKCLKRNYYYSGREWPYKNIKPKIIIEKYIVDESGTELKDYKFFCFNGEVKMLFVAVDRPHNTKFNFYDLNFNKLPFKQHYENFDKSIIKPRGFDKMIELASKLSSGFPHVRVDFYDINGKIYFGELTFYHFSGFEKFEPNEWDKKMGDMIDLSKFKITYKD